LLTELSVAFITRVKKSGEAWLSGTRQKLSAVRFPGNSRCLALGRLRYCAWYPQPLWVPLSRKPDGLGIWGLWYLGANRPYAAVLAVAEYKGRPGWEACLRNAQWRLGFAQACIKAINALSQLFALFALELLIVVRLAVQLLLQCDK